MLRWRVALKISTSSPVWTVRLSLIQVKSAPGSASAEQLRFTFPPMKPYAPSTCSFDQRGLSAISKNDFCFYRCNAVEWILWSSDGSSNTHHFQFWVQNDTTTRWVANGEQSAPSVGTFLENIELNGWSRSKSIQKALNYEKVIERSALK